MPKEIHDEAIDENEGVLQTKKLKEKRLRVNIDESMDDGKFKADDDDLTQQELNTLITRTLLVEDPYKIKNKVEFNFKDGEYQSCLERCREVVLYEIEGSLVHVDGAEDAVGEDKDDGAEGSDESDEEWKERIAEMNESQKKLVMEKMLGKRKKKEEEEEEKVVEEEKSEDSEEGGETEAGDAEGEGEGEGEGERASPIMEEQEEVAAAGGTKKKLVNRFNFSDRSALTYSPLSRDKSTQTAPNPRSHLSGQVSQWAIYDAYLLDYSAAQEAKEKERMSKILLSSKKDERSSKKPIKGEDLVSKKMAESIKILERMLNQNTYDSIAQDCQFYEDPADKFRPDEGSLLPLWEFKYNHAKNLAVTELKWNPAYKDLFGATFGATEFNEQNKAGYLCVFTLKNPSYPEFVKHFDCGATCLDFHPKKCYFVCVGLRDGSVAVFNLRRDTGETEWRSAVERNHRSLVSSVLWCDDSRDRQLAFFSAGADGRVSKWLLVQGELLFTPVITLYINRNALPINPILYNNKHLEIPTSPSCLVFHPKDFEVFMVGTSLGSIYKCSISYASTYFYQMRAHELPVKKISYNHFIPSIFVTCSSDWRVKIWEDGLAEPLFHFNLEHSVGDVQWAPYSSTVLAAVTSVGRVFVYDLNLNKYEPACAQYVVDNVATSLSFNPWGFKMPLILVGDSKGVVTTLKLSPNLRMVPKKPKKSENTVQLDDFGYEVNKLEKILSYVRESNAQRLSIDI